MVRKSDKLVCACITLMLERLTSNFLLKDVLFTRNEIYERVLSLFPEGRFTTYEFRKYVVGFGEDTGDEVLINCGYASFFEYYRLIRPQDYNVERIVEILLSSKWRNTTRYKSPKAIKRFLVEYFSRTFELPKQSENREIITREAIWIATATLTYNEFCRTKSRNKESYGFAQITIAKVANSYNNKNGTVTCQQTARELCTEGRSRQPYSYLVDEGGIRRENRRRLSYFGEFEYTQPELHRDYKVATINGLLTVADIEQFIHNVFSPIFFKRLIAPLDKSHSIEEMQRQAESMDFESLRAAAIEQSEPNPRRMTVSTTHYERNPYIAHYAKVRAMGHCQLCGNNAPFTKANGEPYLETHHIIWLSQGGADAADNVVALCPNCHRKMHIVNNVDDVDFLSQLVLTGK